ncbi:MAG: hypothetical protein ACKOAG_11500 [Candidatus Kapaibacterium sp.]
MKTIFTLLTLLFVVSTAVHTQNATVNIKGKVLEESSGQPLGVEMDMVIIPAKAPTRKIIVKVNSATGEFLQPLTSGDSYTLRFSSYGVFYKEEILDIPATTKFREERKEYRVRRIVQGMLLAESAAFDPLQTIMSSTGTSELQTVLDLMQKNVNLQVVVTLAQETVPPPPPVKAPKPVKKTKGKKTEPVMETPVVAAPTLTNEQLSNDRLAALKTYFSQAKDAEIRVTFAQGTTVSGTPGTKNVRVTVGVVKNLLDE